MTEYMAAKKSEKAQAATEKQKKQKEIFKDNLNKIKQRSKRNDEIIKEINDRNKDNLDKRKEIMNLRKLDQEENYTRSKNFHEFYKLKLVEKIIEK